MNKQIKRESLSYLYCKMVFMCSEFHRDKFVGEIPLDF